MESSKAFFWKRLFMIVKSPAPLILTGVFISLIFLVVVGLIYTSGQFGTSMKPGGGLLDGLIANGISVLISVIIVSPLTVYVSTILMEWRLRPVRQSFVSGISSGIDRIATFYIHQAPLYGNAVLALDTGTQGTAIDQILKAFTEGLDTRSRRMEAIARDIDQTPEEDVELQRSIFNKAKHDAALLVDITSDLYQTFYKETASLENTIAFAMPIFPVELVAVLHEIRNALITYRNSLQDTLSVIAGSTDPRVIASARLSAFDFRTVIENVKKLAASADIIDTVEQDMPSATSMASLGSTYQTRLSEKLVNIFLQAREFDKKKEEFRRG